mmetsp:Transcript_98864/g.308315  ORF Transcript_98864/g.308315 Transcript_98864/m.308315 type:complete len:348 (+) Transcript_98864:62-1105(+)
MVFSFLMTFATWAMMPGLCSVGCLFTSSGSPSLSWRNTVIGGFPDSMSVISCLAIESRFSFGKTASFHMALPPWGLGMCTSVAPGYCAPRSTNLRNQSELWFAATSGYANSSAIICGMPISEVSMLGSGEITERAAKFTRFPIIFILKRPSFFSRSCRMPGTAILTCLPLLPLSMKLLTMVWSCSTASSRPSAARMPAGGCDCGAASFWSPPGSCSFLIHFRTSAFAAKTFIRCCVCLSSLGADSAVSGVLQGRNRLGGTSRFSRKNISAPSSRAPGTSHQRIFSSFFQKSFRTLRTYSGSARASSFFPFFCMNNAEKPCFFHLAGFCLHLSQMSGNSLQYSPRTER